MRLNTPAVISCNEGRREISAMQNIANKQIDKTFVFDKVLNFFYLIYPYLDSIGTEIQIKDK